MAKKKKVPKASKKRLLVFGTLSCFLLTYALFNLAIYSYRIKVLSQEKDSLSKELNDLKEEEDNLKNEISKLKDSEYLARYARENYLYSKDGEYVIQVDDTKKDKENQKQADFFTENKKIIIPGTIVLIIMILYILRTLHKEKKETKKKEYKK